jgi:uncharacterized protein
MRVKPFIKRFHTQGQKYIYDVPTSGIYHVDDSVYDCLGDVSSDSYQESTTLGRTEVERARDAIQRTAAEDGAFKSFKPEGVCFHDLETIKKKLENELSSITLVLTEACNLRCLYCLYSGAYLFERRYSVASLSIEIARAAIDFLIKHSRPGTELNINFYGGEPLLEMLLIARIVDYARTRAGNRNSLSFNVTTNGVLCRGERFDYLRQNNFGILVSIDGPSSLHDRYRQTIAGGGTYDQIVRNLKDNRAKDPVYFKNRTAVNLVLAPPFHLESIAEWTEPPPDWLEGLQMMVNIVSPMPNSFLPSVSAPQDGETFVEQERSLFKTYAQQLRSQQGRVNPFLKALFENDMLSLYRRSHRRLAEGQYRLEHLCIPGLQTLVVGADAELHFCTNMTSHMSIGNVNAGFEIDHISRIIRDYLDTCDECVRCWAIRLCSRSCYEIAAKGEQFDAELKRMVCANIRSVIERNLVYYCEALEQDPSTFAGISSLGKLKPAKDTDAAECTK